MSEVTPEQKASDLHNLKTAHDYYATVIELLTVGRFQFAYEEFQGISNTVAYFQAILKQLKAKIEEIEPPVEKEKVGPMVVDLPTPQAEA